MRTGLPRLLAAVLLALAATRPGWTMQFSTGTSPRGNVYVMARGEIHQGDAAALQRVLGRLAGGKAPAGMLVDSPGGSVGAGAELAELIHHAGLPVGVLSNSKCASACFLLLAASPQRSAGASALVGVHSASVAGRENALSLAVTTAMAREAGRYGVPPGILGKMVQATPGRMEWLTHEDLESMAVRILREGEEPADAAPAAPRPPPAPPAQVALFQGALFCGRSAARVSLRVTELSAAAGRAVLSFAPAEALPALPAGAFALAGRLDLSGGAIELKPDAWMSPQPAGFEMVGLSGQSEDGGRTFTGRATPGAGCTVFTLRRVG